MSGLGNLSVNLLKAILIWNEIFTLTPIIGEMVNLTHAWMACDSGMRLCVTTLFFCQKSLGIERCFMYLIFLNIHVLS